MRNLIKDIKANRPLLIQPEQANAHLERTSKVEMPLGAKLSDFSDMLSAMFGAPAKLEIYPPFAIVPVRGVISKNVSDLDALCGACDIENVEEMLEEAERDPMVKTVILVIDSPGGTSVGVPELARRIRGFSKEVLAFTDNEACSAAYWIGSQAKAFYATPSSTVGSIGCYIAYPDCSKAYEMEGVKMEVLKSGLYKGAGISGTSLDDKQREMLQKEVEEIHADFKADVKAVREFVDDSAMEGQTFSGKNAAEAGLVTGLVNGFDELMESLNASVAEQMEADEKNDAASEAGEMEESDEGASAKARRFASARALAGINLKALSAAVKMSEGEQEEGEDGEDDKKEDAVVSDLDGTIKEDGEDAVNEHVVAHLKKMKAAGFKVHIVTGRLEDEREETEAFLARHKVESDGLHMKSSADDETPGYKVAAVVKLEEEGNKISHILENDPACLEAYKAAGYNCVHPDTLSADEEKPESEDEEEGEDEGAEAKSEDDPDQDKSAPQPKSDEDEKKEDEDAKERAEDEEDDGDDAVDTDEKPDKSGVKRNRSKGVA